MRGSLVAMPADSSFLLQLDNALQTVISSFQNDMQ